MNDTVADNNSANSSMTSMQRVFDAQLPVALRLRSSTPVERIAKLRKLREKVLESRAALIAAGMADFKRPAIEVEMLELMPVILDISQACKQLKKWLKPRKVSSTRMTVGTSAWIRYEPRGRCLIISPWNYPLTLTLGALVPAIASGNTVIIKTSEVAPHFSAVLATIIRETFADNEVALFEGDASVATALLTLPFDHIFFTGAPSIGKLVMAAAARHLSSVTLELGGKCPTIVDRSADLDMAVKTIAWAKFSNCGQTCIAPDHVYVHREVAQPFIAKFKTLLSNLYGEGDAVKSAPLGRIINSRHTRRVAALLNDARHRGAAILHGGLIDETDNFISPTLIGNVPLDAAIMSDEIFGPLLPIIEFSEADDVIAKINAQPKPLALYIWSRDRGACERWIQNTSAGGTCINHQSIQFLHHNLPFGGVNNSGIGSYHGEWGIKAFSHERAIVRSNIMLAGIFLPPYTPWTRRVVDFILRAF